MEKPKPPELNMRKDVAIRTWSHCLWAASSLWNNPPSEEYVRHVATLLYMTAAHESGGFVWRRQRGFGRFSTRGAFGLFQCEADSITRSLRMIASNQRFNDTIMDTLLTDTPGMPKIRLHPDNLSGVTELIQDPSGDALSCALARLHYLRVPSLVPSSLPEMAKYAKAHYNTFLGKATTDAYLNAYLRYWPLLKVEEKKYEANIVSADERPDDRVRDDDADAGDNDHAS